ncbi:MAG: lipid-A-disaccharide synthase [Flavobacteriales bacterium]|jgi:lipid-A-disaccharide synthase
MKYYLIAGEASGDLHASNLMKVIKKNDSNAEFRYWGGDLMQNQGGHLVKHYRELAFMGFIEVIINLKSILGNIKVCKKDIQAYQPDAVILVDYPGFNLRIAPFVKELGIKVVYYISPQIWAWKQSRVHLIKKVVDHMMVILPFEQEFYQKFDMEVSFVGHPLIDAINSFEESRALVPLTFDRPVIALLPGSRKQEIKAMLSYMIAVSKKFTNYQFVIAGAPNADDSLYQSIKGTDIQVVKNRTYDLLNIANAALVTSGTATLETALFGVPQVVCYKGSFISYTIAKQLIKIKYISLVNLIMDKEVVTELIQHKLTVPNICHELSAILEGAQRDQMLEQYQTLKTKLGGGGASAKAANDIKKMLA